jgi:iron complex transport system ATP-binding protein
MDAPPALALDAVTVERWSAPLKRVLVLLDAVSWTVRAGESWVVLGPNGAGKTTLLHLLAGTSHPTAGTVDVLGARLGAVDLRDLRERIGFVDARTSQALAPALTGGQVVLTGAFGSIKLQPKRLTRDHEARAAELLELTGSAELAGRRFDHCSQGERQRLLLARALMADPELLLLDEAAAGLDLPSRERLLAALAGLRAARPALTSVMVTHHLEEIPPAATHALLLRGGAVLAAGPVEEVLTGDRVSACFEVPVEVARSAGGRWTAAVRVAA